MTQFFITFLVLAFCGAINAGSLVHKRLTKKPLICPINTNCTAVTHSEYRTVLGVHKDLLGILYYGVIFVAGGGVFFYPDPVPQLPTILHLATGFGLLFSLYQTYLQAYVIKEYCFYCLISAGLSILLCINSFAF